MLRLHGRPGVGLGSGFPSLETGAPAQWLPRAAPADATPAEAVYWRA
jgi:hypothetical protein